MEMRHFKILNWLFVGYKSLLFIKLSNQKNTHNFSIQIEIIVPDSEPQVSYVLMCIVTWFSR